MKENQHAMENSVETDTEQPEEETMMNDIPFENLHQGTLFARFNKDNNTVTITWVPDEADGVFQEEYDLSDMEFDGESFAECYRECKEDGNASFFCFFRCLFE